MNKQEYLDELDDQLSFLPDRQRYDAVREFASHIDDAAASRPELTEEQVVDRLPPPASVSARYSAESGGLGSDDDPGYREADSAERGRNQSQSRGQGNSHGHGFRNLFMGNFESMFRFARREEQRLEGESQGVHQVEIQAASCDVSMRAGPVFSYTLLGRWSDDDLPEPMQSGDVWSLDCDGTVDSLELILPDSVERVLVDNASGDVDARLPSSTRLMARLASGDIVCHANGGFVEIASASGDITVDGSPVNVSIGSASGDVVVRGASGTIEVSTESGEITISTCAEDSHIKARTMSGDLQIKLAEGAVPEIHAESVSGEIEARGAQERKGMVGSFVKTEGGPGSVYVKCVSGDISIR